MTDYSKSTVAKLREVLKDRGIPTTGLTRKQQIIDRLEEDDRQKSGEEALAENNGEPPEVQLEKPQPIDSQEAVSHAQAQSAEEFVHESASEAAEAPSQDVPPISAPANVAEEEEMPAAPETASAPAAPAEMPPPSTLPETQTAQPPTDTQTSTLSLSQTPVPSHEPPIIEEAPNTLTRESTAQTSAADPMEVLEDSRKRKRRSGSPAEDEDEAVQKRLRQGQDETAEAVGLKEDHVGGLANGNQGPIVHSSEADEKMKGVAQRVEPSAGAVEGVMDTAKVNLVEDTESQSAASSEQELARDGALSALDAKDTPGHAAKGTEAARASANEVDIEMANVADSDARKSSKDARFTSLFSSTAHDEPITTAIDDDRTVAPALHPATRALYIRNFKRPLNPQQLRSHLVSLASPPSSSPNPDILQHFYLDPIRTHCLCLFASVSAASRVRSTLHDSVWPVEKTREALWADFVPDEKVEDWIKEEERAAQTSRMGRRWEVIYSDNTDGAIQAIFQEVGSSNGVPARRSSEQYPPARQSVPDAPRDHRGPDVEISGIHPSRLANLSNGSSHPPTTHHASPQRVPPPPTAPSRPTAPIEPPSKAFLSLDSLFPSTTAKPKLYYKPVSDSLAQQRLKEISTQTSRDYEPTAPRRGREETRRYTFEDGDLLADAGADRDFAGGGWGGTGTKPRGEGGFRGGGFRGDSYAGAAGRGGRGRARGWR